MSHRFNLVHDEKKNLHTVKRNLNGNTYDIAS